MIRLALLCALALLVAFRSAGAAEPPFDPFAAATIEARPGATVPLDLPVLTSTAEETTLGGIADDRPILLVPVQHDCPNVCGVTLGGVADAIAAQPYRAGRDFVVVGFGIDPAETPADAAGARRKLLDRKGGALGDGLHAVTAPAETIEAVTDALGYSYAYDERLGQYAHVAATAVLTPEGRLARWIYGIAPQPTDLRLALTEAGEGRIGDFTDQLLLLCYGYDPETGRYNSLVWTILRGAGGLTLLVIGGFIGISLLRERRAARGGEP